MSDLEMLKAMLSRANISFSESTGTMSETTHKKEGRTIISETVPVEIICLSVERGYTGFVTEFTFALDGRLLDMGAYE